MKLIRAILILLTLAASAWAEAPWDAVCKITNDAPEPGGGNAAGTATLVAVNDNAGLVCSAGHIFENRCRTATITFPGIKGQWRGRVLHCSHDPDICVLRIDNPPAIATPAYIRPANSDGSPYTLVGFPWNGNGRRMNVTGKFIGYGDRSRALFAC